MNFIRNKSSTIAKNKNVDNVVTNSYTVWTEKETQALIKAYKNLMYGLVSYSKSDWVAVTRQLQREGFNKTMSQVYKKWSSLMRTYKVNVEKNRRDPLRTSTFVYFKALDEMFGEERAIKTEPEFRTSNKQIVSKRTPQISIGNSNFNSDDYLIQNSTDQNCSDIVFADITIDDNTSEHSVTPHFLPEPKVEIKTLSARDKYYKAKKEFIENENRRREANFKNKMRCRRERNEFLKDILEAIVAQKARKTLLFS